MENDAAKLAEIIKEKYSDEEDRILLCNMILTRVIDETNITKVQAAGVPELIACKAIGLKWNGKTVHGVDAVDKDGLNVELKTYKRVMNGNRISIMYTLPPRKGRSEDDETYRTRVVNHFLTSPMYRGGHYWIGFDQAKETVLHWSYVDTITVATLINEYLVRNPKSTAKNFGGAICSQCKRCHQVDRIATTVYVPKGTVKRVCDIRRITTA